MNILYITTVFPRPEDGDTIYTDLACELLHRGHRLTVLAADGKKISAGAQPANERGLEVLRVRTGNLYDVGLIKKGIATLLLSHYLKQSLACFLKNRSYDLILYESPPLSAYQAVSYAKKKFHASAFLMLKDIFPQNGVDLEIYRKTGLIYKYFRKQEKALYRVSDKIGCMSRANMEYLKKHNPEISDKIVLFPNTKAVSKMCETSKASVRKSYGLPADKVIFVFGGNIGIPQSPDNVIKCAKKICRTDNAFFLAVGRGTHTNYVKRALNGIPNFKILGELPRCKYEELLSACDVGLIFLDPRFTVPNYPSRILSYMNFSLAVLACIDRAGDINELISDSGCGSCCSADDVTAFERCVKKLCDDSEKRTEMGQNGFSYFKEHLNVGISAELLEAYVKTESGENR